jgi:hypothetical protein
MDDLIEFLRARLDEDEQAARRAADYDDGAAHDVEGPPGTWTCLDESKWFGPSYRGGVIAPRIGNVNAPELGAHIVRHNPARVLAEVDAKRRIVDLMVRTLEWAEGDSEVDHYGGLSAAEDTLDLLALPYAGHSDYRPEWRPNGATEDYEPGEYRLSTRSTAAG